MELKVKNQGAQIIKAAGQSKDTAKGTVKTGKDLRTK